MEGVRLDGTGIEEKLLGWGSHFEILLWILAHSVEAMMHSSGDFLRTPNLDYEAWRDVVRSICGQYTPGGIEPKTFSGRAGVRSILDSEQCSLVPMLIFSSARTGTSVLMLWITTTRYFR